MDSTFISQDWINAFIGGSLIGLAASLMLIFNGRVTGIAGILYGLLTPKKQDFLWRLAFVIGLILGGVLIFGYSPETLESPLALNPVQSILAGLIVGFGTIWGSGCTSGHGVCGISRLSIRSIVATLTFMASGVLTVYLMKFF